MEIFHCYQCPVHLVPVADALYTSRFGWETCYRMELADSSFNTVELVDFVN